MYLFDRKNIEVKVGSVTNSPLPHFDPKGGMGKMVVDLDIEIDGKTSSYILDDTGEVGYHGDIVISGEKDYIFREITRLKNQSEEALKMVPYHEEAKRKCEALMKEFSSEYKERSESTERMNALEQKFDRLSESLASVIDMLKERKD